MQLSIKIQLVVRLMNLIKDFEADDETTTMTITIEQKLLFSFSLDKSYG